MQRVFERLPFFRELVLDANGGILDDPSGHEVLRFKRSKTLGKHSIGDVRDSGLDQRIPRLALQQGLNNGTRPPTADELDSAVETRTDVRDDFSHKGTYGNWMLDTSNFL